LATSGLTRVVFVAQDSFATAGIYKWILMQRLKGFYERTARMKIAIFVM